MARWATAIALILGTVTGVDAAAHEVTIAARITDAGGDPIELRIAVPRSTPWQNIRDLRVTTRGLEHTIQSGDHPNVLLRGAADDRRVSVTFTVDLAARKSDIPPVWPTQAIPLDALSSLRPAPLFPSRSILVREFLETHAAPLIGPDADDMLRAIYDVTREHLQYTRDGKSLPLDVLRRRQGKRIGIERVFTASLRSAGIPARFVEGIDLGSSTRKKRRFWTEVWSDGTWYPVSASGGWLGKRPRTHVAMAIDGHRVVKSFGAGEIDYQIIVRPVAPEASNDE